MFIFTACNFRNYLLQNLSSINFFQEKCPVPSLLHIRLELSYQEPLCLQVVFDLAHGILSSVELMKRQ